MNHYLPVNLHQLRVANAGDRLAITCDRRLDLDGPAPRQVKAVARWLVND